MGGNGSILGFGLMRETNPYQTGDGFGGWMNDRTGRLTASRMASAMAFLKSGAEASERRKLKIEILCERLTGDIVPKYVTNEMQWGIDQEPAAKEMFQNRTGLVVSDLGFVEHPSIEWCGASPDGIIRSENHLIEIKCPSSARMIEWWLAGTIPEEYKPQMILQSACMGGLPVYFCAFDPRLPDKQQMIIRKFFPTAQEIETVETMAKNFLAEIETMFEQLTQIGD